MDALYFLCSIIGIGVVMHWLIINDKVAPDKPTQGLLAMLDGADKSQKRKGKNRPFRLAPEKTSLEKTSVPPSRSRL